MHRQKNLLLLLAVTLVGVNSSLAQQVIPVVDKMLRDSIGENATRNTKQAGYLTFIRRMTKNTREDVMATEQLQSDYRAFLRQTGSTASLALLDNEVEQQTVGRGADASGYLNAYSFAENLSEVYADQTAPMDKSQVLHERLIPIDETLVFTNLSSLEEYQKARQLNVTALEEMSQRRKLQLANTYRQFAEQRIAKADELRHSLTSNRPLPGRGFSMTEGERLEILRRMHDYLLSSQQLNDRADELIRQTAKPTFQKQQVVKSLQQQQERNAMANTPLF